MDHYQSRRFSSSIKDYHVVTHRDFLIRCRGAHRTRGPRLWIGGLEHRPFRRIGGYGETDLSETLVDRPTTRATTRRAWAFVGQPGCPSAWTTRLSVVVKLWRVTRRGFTMGVRRTAWLPVRLRPRDSVVVKLWRVTRRGFTPCFLTPLKTNTWQTTTARKKIKGLH